MMTRRTALHLTIGLFLILVVLSASPMGCNSVPPPREVEPPPYVQDVSKEKLIYNIQLNVQNFASLQCPVEIRATDQKMLVPASAADSLRMKMGKPYEKAPNTRKLSGYLVFERQPPTQRIQNRVKFVGEIMGERVITLMAYDDVFIVKLRKANRKLGELPFSVYKGRFDPEVPRSKDSFSMRPQDIMNLFLCREMLTSFDLEKIKATFVEVWPDYYILSVLRVDPDRQNPVQLYSRIWVERHSLMVAIHQLYEPSGAMVAEARFQNYILHQQDSDEIYVPRQVRFIWPRDKVTIDCTLRTDKMSVNYKVDEKFWKPPRETDADVIQITSTTRGHEFTPVGRDAPQKPEEPE